MPQIPQNAAGTRIEPFVSVPRLSGTKPPATAAALDAEIGRLEGEKEAVGDRLKELRDLRRRVR